MSAYTYVVASDSGRTGVAVTTGCSGVGPVPGCGEEGQSFFCVYVCGCVYVCVCVGTVWMERVLDWRDLERNSRVTCCLALGSAAER